MTKIYTAGEHARVIKTNNLFSGELGDQTGLVGTVTQPGSANGAYLKFPHTGDNEFYYNASEIEPVGAAATPAPEPVKEYLFREGDTVRFIDTTTTWQGSEFTVSHDVEKPSYGNVSIRLVMTKTTEGLKRIGYNVGREVGLSSSSVEKFTPKPEPKFKEGDWVQVHGRNDSYDGWVVQITAIAYSSVMHAHLYTTQHNGDPSPEAYAHFFEGQLKASEKPADPHWTVAKPVGTVGTLEDRKLVKLETDKWLFIYPEAVGTFNNARTVSRLLGLPEPKWVGSFN